MPLQDIEPAMVIEPVVRQVPERPNQRRSARKKTARNEGEAKISLSGARVPNSLNSFIGDRPNTRRRARR
jgi:hypothetical protein